jgi:hypothetical protein
MHDVNNRLSSVDLSVPGGRFVIASDENGTINPDASELLPLIPISYTTSAAAGWGRGLLDPSAIRLAPRLGFALALDDSRAVDIPNRVFGTANFGRIFSAKNPREMQFGLRVSF